MVLCLRSRALANIEVGRVSQTNAVNTVRRCHPGRLLGQVIEITRLRGQIDLSTTPDLGECQTAAATNSLTADVCRSSAVKV